MNEEQCITKYTLPLGSFRPEFDKEREYVAELEIELRPKRGKSSYLAEESGFIELSIVGGFWPKGRRADWSGGQCGESLLEMMKGTRGGAIMAKVWPVWERWHLNGLKAGCQHQRKNWKPSAELELIHYTWSESFRKLQGMAQAGELAPLEYENFSKVAPLVNSVCIDKNGPKWEAPLVLELIDKGLIKEKNRETKTAHWVYPSEHPDGVLCKPCEICGYSYGSQWLYEKLPPNVLALVMDRFRLGSLEIA